jgi:hypothetical protein
MRPGDRANTVQRLRDLAKSIEAQADQIESGPLPNLLNVGYGWTDNGPTIDLGGTFKLTVMNARVLVSSLLAAIYSLGGNGNSPGQKHEHVEHAFIDALKTGLTFPLKEDQISGVLERAIKGAAVFDRNKPYICGDDCPNLDSSGSECKMCRKYNVMVGGLEEGEIANRCSACIREFK